MFYDAGIYCFEPLLTNTNNVYCFMWMYKLLNVFPSSLDVFPTCYLFFPVYLFSPNAQCKVLLRLKS